MKTITKILSITIILFCTSSIIKAGDWNKLLNLKGWWKFSIGDDKQWASQYFKDKDWEEIRVPSQWEDQGFYGYDGYAWYRKHFFCSSDFKGKSIYLSVGYIDDVDEVYLNGTLIGTTGSFPPDYNTAYNSFRKYYVPENLLKFNSDNVIAVRVYDSQMGGGIVSGDVGFFYQANSLPADVVLEGVWKFRTGDNTQWADKNYNDTEWGKIFVPGYWENQGYNEYDGFAWYRKKFYMDNDLLNKKLVLMVGKIDDLDEVYVNGKLVGSTGQMRPKYGKIRFDDEYSRFRGYYLPDNLLVKGENTIAVRVYDGYNVGGIYEGPVGIISQEKYTKFWRNQKKSRSFWDVFFGNE